jgi:hypothetical protein
VLQWLAQQRVYRQNTLPKHVEVQAESRILIRLSGFSSRFQEIKGRDTNVAPPQPTTHPTAR